MNRSRFLTATGLVVLAGLWAAPVFAQAAKPKPISHATEGRAQCMMCHKAGAMEAVPDAPADHADRPVETCLYCHATDSPILTADPPVISHTLEGRAQCMMCHKAGAMEAVPDAPASHASFDVKYCTLCHKSGG